jgi:hypothetical protein
MNTDGPNQVVDEKQDESSKANAHDLASKMITCIREYEELPPELQAKRKELLTAELLEKLDKLRPAIRRLESRAERGRLVANIFWALAAADLVVNLAAKIAELTILAQQSGIT